jgi:hypothetical protein
LKAKPIQSPDMWRKTVEPDSLFLSEREDEPGLCFSRTRSILDK